MPSLINKDRSIDYFGEFSLANLLDWMVTFCLGGILALTAIQLGGVRPETQLLLLPLYLVLLVLHGCWLALSRERPRRINPVPLLLIPFFVWGCASIYFWTPTPWRGSYELVNMIAAFIFGWVAINNVRTRAHLWVLIIISLVPLGLAVLLGYYQFFQDSTRIVSPALSYSLKLSDQYIGQATGIFADPGSLAAFLIILLPTFLIVAFVPRLPTILRVLSVYVAAMLVVGITLTQIYWAAAVVVALLAIVPWLCFESKKKSCLFSVLGVALAALVFLLMYLFSPLFKRGLEHAISPEGEGVRLLLWNDVIHNILNAPLLGSGAGSYAFMVERSSELSLAGLPVTPHNDFLLILGCYGLVGGVLLFAPLIYVFYQGLRHWFREPFQVKRQGVGFMPAQKFFLSLAVSGVIAFSLCAAFHKVIYIPSLMLYGVLVFSIMAKSSFRRTVKLPDFRLSGVFYLLVFSCIGGSFWAYASTMMESQGLELRARDRLEDVVEGGISVSGNFSLVDKVILLYEDALIMDSNNADAWVGLSMAVCQLHYRDPSRYAEIGARAVDAAGRAYEICPGYWLASAQLGVAYSLSGQIDEARIALKRAVDLAPNVSNAHYYYAAFLSEDSSTRDEAMKQVRRALEIDPENEAALRLQQKLLIL